MTSTFEKVALLLDCQPKFSHLTTSSLIFKYLIDHHMMKGLIKRFLLLLLILGLFSPSMISVVSARNLNPYKDDHIIDPFLLDVSLLDLSVDGIRELKETSGVVNRRGRMNIELTDYPGTGANDQHNPKPPGAV